MPGLIGLILLSNKSYTSIIYKYCASIPPHSKVSASPLRNMYTICKKAVLHCQITPLFTNFKPKKQYCLTFIPVLGIKLILSKSHRCPHKHVVLDFQPTHRCLLPICFYHCWAIKIFCSNLFFIAE